MSHVLKVCQTSARDKIERLVFIQARSLHGKMFKILRLNSFENYLLVACLGGHSVRRWTQRRPRMRNRDRGIGGQVTGRQDRVLLPSLLAKFPEQLYNCLKVDRRIFPMHAAALLALMTARFRVAGLPLYFKESGDPIGCQNCIICILSLKFYFFSFRKIIIVCKWIELHLNYLACI